MIYPIYILINNFKGNISYLYDSNIVNNFFIRRLNFVSHINFFFHFFHFSTACSFRMSKKKRGLSNKADSQSSILRHVILHNVVTRRLLSPSFVSLCEGCEFKTHSNLHSLTFCINSKFENSTHICIYCV